jgi:hypothetical protein
VVSRSLARQHFAGGRAIGRGIRIGRAGGAWHTVVGVVPDRVGDGFGAAAQPPDAVYLSLLQHPPRTTELLVASGEVGTRGRGEAGVTMRVRGAWASLVAAEAAPVDWFARWLRVLGWAALAVTTLGMFAVMRLWVRALLHELGVRRALGAGRARVLGFVAVRAVGVVVAGVAVAWWLGPVAADAAARVVGPLPPWAPAEAALPLLALTVATLIGALAPALRAVQGPPAALLGTDGH